MVLFQYRNIDLKYQNYLCHIILFIFPWNEKKWRWVWIWLSSSSSLYVSWHFRASITSQQTALLHETKIWIITSHRKSLNVSFCWYNYRQKLSNKNFVTIECNAFSKNIANVCYVTVKTLLHQLQVYFCNGVKWIEFLCFNILSSM